MVSSTVHENGDVASDMKISETSGVPPGNYRLLGWDMDATGKRFVDDICQIAVYAEDSEYAQYIMPFKNLSRPAKKRHNLTVVTMGRYRVLKNNFTNKFVKTKTEILALNDFLEWLEKVRGDATDGVILVHHEPRRVNPSMLIEALTKYNLLERFKQTVKGFANGFDIAKAKCANTLKSFSLRTLSRIFLEKEEELSSAAQRARLAFQVVQYLSIGEENGKVDKDVGSCDDEIKTSNATIEFIREFVQSVDAEEKEYAELKLIWNRLNSLKPIFGPLISNMDRRKRRHANPLRRLLAESAIDYVQLQEAWANNNKEGLKKLIDEKVTAKKKDIEDLIEVLECHFDPDKAPIIPIVNEKNSKKIKSKKNMSLNNNNLSDTQSPDTTLQSPIKSKNEDDIVPAINNVSIKSD